MLEMCLLKRLSPLRKHAAYDNVYICKVLLIINFVYIEAYKNIRFLLELLLYNYTTTTTTTTTTILLLLHVEAV